MPNRFVVALPLFLIGINAGCARPAPPAAQPSLASATLGHWEPSKLDAARRAKLERLVPQLDQLFADDLRASQAPGMAVGIVLGGEVVYAKGYGLRDIERKLPFEADTPFPIASVTKSFAAMTILRLRDEGKLDLDVPAARYYPPLARITPATRDSPPITLRMLLTHASGMPEDNPWADVTENLSEEDLARLLDGAQMSRAPGTEFEYSNVAWAVIGRIIDRVSGMPAREAIRRTVFGPLGLSHTGWWLRDFPQGTAAIGYRGRDGDEDMSAPRVSTSAEELGTMDTAGGIYTTARDLLRYVAFHVSAWPARDDPETGPVRRSSVREMQQGMRTWSAPDFIPTLTLRSPPAMARIQDGHLRVRTMSYGFGLFSEKTCEEDFQVEHSGGVPGYTTLVSMLPQKGFGMVVFLNDERARSHAIEGATRMLREAGLIAPPRIEPLPALAAAPAAVAGLMSSWDDARARALLEPTFFRYQTIEAFKDRFARLSRDHGKCRLEGEPWFVNRMRGRWQMTCERGALTFAAGLAPGPNPRLQGLEVREDLPPSAALQRAGAACTELLSRWDEGAAASLFAKEVDRPRVQKSFAQLAIAHGKCRLDREVEGDGTSEATFSLACADGPLELTLAVDGSGRVTSASGRPPRSETAPNCAE